MDATVSAEAAPAPPGRGRTALLGVLQILSWGGSFYLMSVLASPIMEEFGWSHDIVMGAVSFGLLVAGVASPWCGRLISAGRGRQLVAGSGLVMALGLCLLAAASSRTVFVLAWAVIGLAMAAGLYDSLFSTLGAAFGTRARASITGVTLISGFCSALIWPVLAALTSAVGWRMTCLVYAAVMLATIPLYRACLPDGRAIARAGTQAGADGRAGVGRAMYLLMSVVFAIAASLIIAFSVFMLVLLQSRGMTLAAAIAMGSVVAPAGVACRLIDLVARNAHPIWMTVAGTVASAVGLALVTYVPAATLVGLVLFGAGNGVRAIVKSTLPMMLVSGDAYARLSNRLARPMFIAQAATPIACGLLVSRCGPEFTLRVLSALALVAMFAALALAVLIRRRAPSRRAG